MNGKVLVVTSKIDVTADLVVFSLKEKGAEVVRFNVEDYPQLESIEIQGTQQKLDGFVITEKFGKQPLNTFNSIYYRPHQPPTPASDIAERESRQYIEEQSNAALSYLLDNYHGFCVSKPSSIRRATSKTLQIKIAQDLGMQIPRTLITNHKEEFLKFYETCDGEVIAKNLINEGIIQNMEGFIYANKITDKDIENIEDLKFCPVLFQEYIPKKVELRVTVIGRKVFAVSIDSQSLEETKIDWRRYDLKNPPLHEDYKLPSELEEGLCTILDRFDLEFGAFDLILTPSDKYVFLELNANGQWGWIQYMTGLPLKETLADLLIRAHH